MTFEFRPLSASSDRPTYKQIADVLRGAVTSGEVAAGSALPSEKELMDGFKVARGTARQAVAILKAEGLIETSRGRGAIVCHPTPGADPVKTCPHCGFDPECRTCDRGGHTCPGCGTDVNHRQTACRSCGGREPEYEGLMHKRAWSIGGMKPDDRLMGQVKVYSRLDEVPSREQVAAVLHALADYTLMQQAVQWVPSEGDGPAHPVCRFMHDLGDYLEDR